MSPVRVLKVMQKDFKLSPRSPIFIWALVFPVVITLVIRMAFGSMAVPQPRLGIVDQGDSLITKRMSEMQGIELTRLNAVTELKRQVQRHDLDAGLFLKTDFDQEVRSGSTPLLQFWLSGKSLASNRVILEVKILDLVREVAGKVSPVAVKVNHIGNREVLSISARLIPLVVLMVLLIAGVFVTASSLVEERESQTLGAILVTPVKISEVLMAKAGFGLILAFLMALMTLFLNDALGSRLSALLVALWVAALMAAEFGLIYGLIAKDIKVLFTLVKTLNLFLLAPVIFYIFPDWPQWIARIFPTYWIINPIFEIAIKDGGLMDVAFDLGVALGINSLLILIILGLSRRMPGRHGGRRKQALT